MQHHSHHHLDEFSVSDLRHTVLETLRVLADRRWWFIIPFCVVSTAAFIASHAVPRRYSTRTQFERRNDPVLAGLLGQRWTQPYEEQKGRINADLKDRANMVEVLAGLDLPTGLKRFPDGRLTPEAEKARERLADEVIAGLTAKFIETSVNRDVVELSLTLGDKTHLPAILAAIRERYIENTRVKTVGVLNGALEFFQSEAERSTGALRELERKLADAEHAYPGVNPDAYDPIEAERTRLIADRAEHRRRIGELTMEREQNARTLARLVEKPDEKSDAANAVEAPLIVNPRFAELTAEMKQIDRDIEECMTVKQMTEQHPRVASLRAKRRSRAEELNTTPPRIPSTDRLVAAASNLPAEENRIRAHISELDARIAARTTDIAGIERHMLDLQARREQALEHRQAYLDLRGKAVDAKAELNAWQQQLVPIRRILTVESKNRGIHFLTREEPAVATRPSYPASLMVLSICLISGVVVGVVGMLLSELIDRSFRTTRQITTALGVPLIESIDEIVTAAIRRKRLVRRLVAVPVATFLMLFVMAIAGAMAYLSIEHPNDFDKLTRMPAKTMRGLIGQYKP